VQVAGAGERFVRDRTEAGLGRCGCCTLVLHYLRRVRTRDHSLVRSTSLAVSDRDCPRQLVRSGAAPRASSAACSSGGSSIRSSLGPGIQPACRALVQPGVIHQEPG
jgi:hypothetical protein